MELSGCILMTVKRKRKQVGDAGFRIEKKLKQGALYLYVGNGVREQERQLEFQRLLQWLFQKFTDYGISISKNNVLYFNAVARNGVYEIDMHDLVPNNNSIYNLTPPYTPQHNGVSKRRNRTLLDMALVKRDTPDKLEQRSVKCIFNGYPKEMMGYYFYFPPENKIVVARYVEFFEKRLINQEISGRAVDLEEIQEQEDTSPSEITNNIPQEVEGFGPPAQEEEIPIQSNKWIDAMNAEIQSMMDNKVWVLVNLPPSCKTVGSKWLFKKKTDMDGIIHVYKARLVAKVFYTELLRGLISEENILTLPLTLVAIRILISISSIL
ncbi:retrotransposon protein, putative, ty1-copia subclass [Tanacetum coccineum]